MFTVTADQNLRLLHVTLRGFWDAETMAEYMKVVRRAIGELRRTGGCHYVLINMMDFAIQTREVAEGHAENLRQVKAQGGTKVALVMQSALSKLQAARVASDTGHQTFATEQAALEWLLEEN